MKIGFDAKRAVNNKTGLGNYSRLIIDVLSEYFPENDYLLYTPKIKENNRLKPFLERNNIELCPPSDSIGRTFSSLWRVGKGIVKDYMRDQISLFHGLSNELPLAVKDSVPSVVTIHDLIFLHFPQFYKPIDCKIYNYKFRKACENASRIIAVSECTKRDIVNIYGTEPDKIDVVYQGCDESFKRECSIEEMSNVRRKYGLPDSDFVLYVGTVEERKNVLLAVKALRNMDKNAKLVIVGRETHYARQVHEYVNKYGLEAKVLFRQIHFQDLPAVYQMARAFTYPSRYEGFGIPLLEALCSGVPVVAATGSCLEEAGGEGSIYVNPDDEEGLASALTKVMKDESLRNEMIIKGNEYAAKFTRKNISDNVMNVYKKVL